MASLVHKIRSAKTTHKLVAPPTAVASIGGTYYLVNLIKASLDSSASSMPPEVKEEHVEPTQSAPAPQTSEGSVDLKTNDSESGSSTHVQGDRGTDSTTQAQQAGEKQTSPEAPEAPSAQTESVQNNYTNDQTQTEQAKEKQDQQLKDSGASRHGEGTPEGKQQEPDLDVQIPLLIEWLSKNEHFWKWVEGKEETLDALHHQRQATQLGTPLLKAVAAWKKANPGAAPAAASTVKTKP